MDDPVERGHPSSKTTRLHESRHTDERGIRPSSGVRRLAVHRAVLGIRVGVFPVLAGDHPVAILVVDDPVTVLVIEWRKAGRDTRLVLLLLLLALFAPGFFVEPLLLPMLLFLSLEK